MGESTALLDEMTISVFAIFTRPTCRSQMFRQPLHYDGGARVYKNTVRKR
jgi:hypothetical protein